MPESYAPYIVGVALWLAVGFAGGKLTDLGDWYQNLAKPSWQPPGWLFAPVWTTLFLMIGVATGLAWTQASPGMRSGLFAMFGVNAALNMGWSALFFRAKRPDLALGELIPFWASIAALIIALWPVSTTAALLLAPYAAWVAFAGVLNWTVARMNSGI
jgi:translocator protein